MQILTKIKTTKHKTCENHGFLNIPFSAFCPVIYKIIFFCLKIPILFFFFLQICPDPKKNTFKKSQKALILFSRNKYYYFSSIVVSLFSIEQIYQKLKNTKKFNFGYCKNDI